MGHASQNKVLATVRGSEVVSDPTNVMALECARRLRRDRATVVRLATSHRCIRAQTIPPGRGFTANFRLFCLASAYKIVLTYLLVLKLTPQIMSANTRLREVIADREEFTLVSSQVGG